MFITILSCQQIEHNKKTKQKINFSSQFTHFPLYFFQETGLAPIMLGKILMASVKEKWTCGLSISGKKG